MRGCDQCGDEVKCLLRHREYGASTTHRTSRWLCRECHPEFATDADGEPASDADHARPSETVLTDGGSDLSACPRCRSSVANVQGIFDCLDCRWTGR